jgi:mannan endo-1,4-beta-mannosidase
MRDHAAGVFAADPHANTLFSIHMYGVFDTAAEVSNYLQTFVDNGLPIMVGEFGHNHSDGDPDENAIMATAEALGIGYVGWSWSGNSGGVEYLDMVNGFDPDSLTSWGQRIFHGADGIVATAECATVYECEPPVDDTEPPSQPGLPAVTDVTATTAVISWAESTDNVGVSGYDVYLDDELATSTSTASAALTGLTPATAYIVHVVARDAAGNESEPSSPVDFTTDESAGTDCAVAFDTSPWTSQPGQGGFTAYLSVTNNSDEAIEGWTLGFALPQGHGFTQGWSATWSVDGPSVTASNLTWNRVISPGESKDIGFNGSWTGSFTEPIAFTLNGSPCGS